MQARSPRRTEMPARQGGGLGNVRVVSGARGYAPPPSDTAPLPAGVVKALKAVVADMRNVPRDVITDRGELIHFLNRMARRVDGVAALRVSFTPPTPKRSPVAVMATRDGQNGPASVNAGKPGTEGVPAPQGALSGHALAAAVFGGNVGNSHISTKGPESPETLGTDLHDEDTSAKGTQAVSTPVDYTAPLRTPRSRGETRTVTSRKGKAVPVLIRRAREAGQIELF